MKFYLGSHHPHWLRLTGDPLFISHRTLRKYKTLPVALGPWALDSGGFSELSLLGGWETTPTDYINAVRRYQAEVGRLAWCAPQDWMCEPHILARTGLTITDHQQHTITSYLQLRDAGLPVIPVLQGWHIADYLTHLDQYAAAGVDLTRQPLVGVGSVCRRQHSDQIRALMTVLAGQGLRLHGFGVKQDGLVGYGDHLASADSMAWSFAARHQAPLFGHQHKNCANCLPYALNWRDRLLDQIEQRAAMPQQQILGVTA